MKILAQGRDIYNRVFHCELCHCVFQADREDAEVYLENDVCKCYVECPSCYSRILVAWSSQQLIHVKRNR